MPFRPMLTAISAGLILATALPAMGEGEITPETAAKTVKWQLSVTGNSGTWKSRNLDNGGSQSQVLTQIVYTGDGWGAGVTGRAVKNEYHSVQSPDPVSFTTMTDTTASAYYTIKKDVYVIRCALDAGLPTGKSSYTTSELKSVITDPVNQDLMILNQFGFGLNIAPNVMISRKISQKFTVGAGLRYDYRGPFDITRDQDDEKIDPGDRFLFLFSGAYERSASGYLMLTAAYNRGSADKRGSKIIFREGDSYFAEVRYIAIWSETTKSSISVTYSSQAKNEFLDASKTLSPELHNSNNNWWEIFLYTMNRRTDLLAVTGIAGFKQVSGNQYQAGHTLHDGGRSKYYLEPGLALIFRETFYSTVKLRYTSVEDKKDGFSPENSTYGVYNLDVAMVYNF